MIKKFCIAAFAALVLAAGLAAPHVFGQASGSFITIGPMTRDLGALRTMTAQTAATVTSSDQNGFNVSRVTCVLRQASAVGSPSTVFSIQNKDAASGAYYALITSSAITTTSTNPISAGAGVTTTANASAGLPIAATWRVSVTVSGTTSVTGTVGCTVQ